MAARFSSIWLPVVQELNIWDDHGLCLDVWWRDDDASRPSKELDTLLEYCCTRDIPVTLAVIPTTATQSLAARTVVEPGISIVVHGLSHANRAAAEEPPSEFPDSLTDGAQRASAGLHLLQSLFGNSVLPVFAPPWNSCGPNTEVNLSSYGFRGISKYGLSTEQPVFKGVKRLNVHINPIDWGATPPNILPMDVVVAEIVKQLRDRREKRNWLSEPLGIMSHHADHNDEIWNFFHAFADVLANCNGVNFRSIEELISSPRTT
jgi:hypothetical protein